MGGHKGEAYQNVLLRNSGCDDRGDEHALVVSEAHYLHSLHRVPYEQRDDGRLGVAGVEARVLEGLLGVAGDFPEILPALGLGNHYVQGLGCGRYCGRSH